MVAAINPLSVGGGRNRLPRSFERLFTVISLQEMSDSEIRIAAHNLFVSPAKPGGDLSAHFLGGHSVPVYAHRATELLLTVRREVAGGLLGQEGGPYIFNLRDVEKLDAVLASNARALWLHISSFVDGGCRSPTGAGTDDLRVLIWHKLLRTVVQSRFRSATDRARVQSLIDSYFPAPRGALASGWDDMDVDVSMSGFVRVGALYTNASGVAVPELDPDVVYIEPFVSLLEQLLLAVNANLPVLIEGPTATMKSLCVRELARLLNQCLHVIPLSADTEVADLLGQFVLVGHGAPTNVTLREATAMCSAVHVDAGALVANLYRRVGIAAVTGLLLSRNMLDASSTCLSVVSRVWAAGESREDRDGPELALVIAAGAALHAWALATAATHTSGEDWGLQGVLRDLPPLLAVLRQAHPGATLEKMPPSFLWRDGKLVVAMTRGEWVLLEGVSNAPQEVLERLNPTLEHTPSLVLDEVRWLAAAFVACRLLCCLHVQYPIGYHKLPSVRVGSQGNPTSCYAGRLSEFELQPVPTPHVCVLCRRAATKWCTSAPTSASSSPPLLGRGSAVQRCESCDALQAATHTVPTALTESKSGVY